MKRIVICADGTWNIRDQLDKETNKRRPTNVTKLARSVRTTTAGGVPQVVFYCDGVGTGRGMDKITGGAFGNGIEDNVRDLYREIVYNYEPGDEIFLFGFSRGAFTVRTLVGFMHFAGLVEKDDDYFVPDLYACYESQQGPGTEQWKVANRKVSGTRPCPPIKMMGVWDTVGALGAPGVLGQLFNSDKYKHHDVSLLPAIQNAFHALAIDERRKPFAPNIWVKPPGWTGQLVQAWFAGVHSNVGGGYTPDGLANEALHWIVGEAKALGLEVDGVYLKPFQARHDSKLHDSMSLAYRAMGAAERRLGDHAASGEAIHESAVSRAATAGMNYQPANALAYLKSPGHRVVSTKP
jgi:uncharacterized protein (DUF2235 family)